MSDSDPGPLQPPASRPERKWTPPLLLAAAAFLLGLFGDMADTTSRIASWIRPPPLPQISEEYLMVEMEPGLDLRDSFAKISQQVQGVQMIRPDWTTNLDAQVDKAKRVFCHRAVALIAPQGDADLAAACLNDADTQMLLGTYALRSFNPDPITGLRIQFALLDNEAGAVDAYDGFVDGLLSTDPPCFKTQIAGDCVARRVGDEIVADLPVLDAGEQLIVPIFASVRVVWSPDSLGALGVDPGEPLYDGLAPTPFRFPAKVFLGDRVLIDSPRAMRETPSLRQGFYEGRG